ncbi:hypothetical protein PIB30_091008, partial [Stylosanthes scabra]|nr:hypothetical protein [Stylosanthes scabra]
MQHAVREDNRTSRIRFKSKGILTGGGFRRPVAENRTTAAEQSSPATVSPMNAGGARFKDIRGGSATDKGRWWLLPQLVSLSRSLILSLFPNRRRRLDRTAAAESWWRNGSGGGASST